MRKKDIEVGKAYAVRLKTSKRAQAVIVKMVVNDTHVEWPRVRGTVQDAGLAIYPEARRVSLKAQSDMWQPLNRFIEPWETYAAAQKAADLARYNETKATSESAVKKAARLERVEKLVIVLQGIDYHNSYPLVEWLEENFGGDSAPLETGTIDLTFLESIAARIEGLQRALVGHSGGWVESSKTEVDRLNDDLARQQEETARLSLRLKKDGYSFRDITDIAKGVRND